MREFTKIDRSFWESDEARDMTPEEKYFWMYLQTNANVNTLGCYIFRMRRAIDETGYNQETIEKLLAKMVEYDRIAWDVATGEIFLLHFSEIGWNRMTATIRALTGDMKAVKSEYLRELLESRLEEKKISLLGKKDSENNLEQFRTNENNLEQFRTNENNLGEEEEEEEEEKRKVEKKKDADAVFYPAVTSRGEYTEVFEAFWKAYPNKKNKGKAAKAWDKLRVTEELLGRIQHGLAAARRSRDWTKDGGEFIPHPATWLNARGWESEYLPGSGIEMGCSTKAPENRMGSSTIGTNEALEKRRAMMGL